MIRWFAKNDIAANFLLFGILIWGIYSAVEEVPLEVQPAVVFKQVNVEVPYRGGSPEDVEKSVLIPIERSLEGLKGVEEMDSRATSGNGRVTVRVEDGTDPEDLLEEIKTRVSRINTFPNETEPVRVEIPDSTSWFDVIKIAVAGDMDEADLLQAARRVRDDLVEMRGISQATVLGASPLEISIEADPQRLRDYGLTLNDLTDAIQRSSIDLPAGSIQTEEGNLLIRSKGQAYNRDDFANIVITNTNGSEVHLGQVAKVTDGFEEDRKIVRFNGKRCLLIEALRLNDENALDIADKVKHYAATASQRFPEGITLHIWDDSSVELRGRLGTLLGSLMQGGILVLLALGLFLRPSIAFWVVLGIPVSFAGGLIMMPYFGMTANVMSIFGFIIVLGIVVDDGIVTAENIYTKLKDGVEPMKAVTEGAQEVAVPVTFGALTTIIAFVPLMFFEGFYGSFTRQIPPIVTAVLVFSLIESKFALPCHLKHVKVHRQHFNFFERFQKTIADGLEKFVEKVYDPTLRIATRHRYITLSLFLALGMASIGIFTSGKLGFVNMPSIDQNRINARIRMPHDTPISVTDDRVNLVASKVEELRKEFVDPGTGKSLIQDMVTSSGGWAADSRVDQRTGFVTINVMDPGDRSTPGPRNSEIAARWLELVGDLPDVENLRISGERGGGGGDDELETLRVEIRGKASEDKDECMRQAESLLESYPGIASAWNDAGGSRDELLISIRPEGEALGLTQRDLARQVRSAFFGEEAQRVQRDRDDIRVMVRLPLQQRQSLHTLEQLRIRTPAGGEAPFRSVATATFSRSPSDINRIDGAQVVTVAAQPEDETVDIVAISRNLAPKLDEIFNRHPGLSWRYTGYIAEHEETKKRSIYGGVALFLAMYALLAVPFRSLYQPFFVMLAIPFGAIGALFGHMLMDITPSYLSVFGILALAGVAINDSLVMVDFINQKLRNGEDLFESVIQSGTRRFRPIFLTSLTTFVGLVPLLFDPSLQAQFLIPMATSLAFGILFSTAITLYLIPSAYVAAEDLMGHLRRAWIWYRYPSGLPKEPEMEGETAHS
ncbi:efflux RND transporter permease subunit [Luteolibacter pohnpeiensis]|uniref:Efflux RND transporter permease subunit n=1 Tax=Luteolibacter pohnpeiensis TaxID=454153 RepID=A0A934S408_9BACT|nr:efflux RND transporter permease subunit [Luteolibacter pohnpeiensis]MBK1881503.1 efflux RND transporter permease subunit [Luteolibacter pohnpeiensis]